MLKKQLQKIWQNRLIKSVLVVASGTAGAQAIGMAFVPFITRTYGPEVYGTLGAFIALTGVLTTLAALAYLKSETRTQVEFTEVVSSKALKEVYSRRKQYIDTVKEVRLHSSHEWFALWPYTMRETSPNITVNRRLFPSYEVYLSNKVVKVSSVVLVCWKTNRKLFNRATKNI